MKAAKQISIHADTRIKTLLDADKQGVIDELVKLNKNFAKLKNPVLRSLFASRVTIADACKIAHCNLEDFLTSMNHIGFHTAVAPPAAPSLAARKTIDFSLDVTTYELDVRTPLENNEDPLKDILAIVNKMSVGERVKLTNTFEPIPLISLLTDKGFSYQVDFVQEDLVITWFEKQDPIAKIVSSALAADAEDNLQLFNKVLGRYKQEQITHIDVRALQMPQPMLLIIENLDRLPSDGILYVYHKKVPIFLLPELDKRGMVFLFNHKSATEVDLLIYKS